MRTFEAQSRGPRARCLRFTTWVTPPPCKTRFQPAGSALTGQDLHLLGSILEFQGDMVVSFPNEPGLPGALKMHAKAEALIFQ